MSQKTIDRDSAISLFHQLMQSESEFRILRLVGEAKLGKSHLVTKIFPLLASQTYRAHYAVIDLRSQGQTIPDVLHTICGLLGGENVFPSYYDAYKEWIQRPKLNVSGLQAFFAHVDIRSESESDENRMACYLVPSLIAGLGCLDDTQLLLLFDTLDTSGEKITSWLMNTLLVHLSALAHVRIVVAGRSVPEACGSYATICRSYSLLPVVEEDAYVVFCRELGIGTDLEDQTIRAMARLFDYKPGLFVDFVIPKFMP